MESLQVAVAGVLGVVVILFVPALVWATVIARLIQIVTRKVRESRMAQARQTQKAQQPASRL